MIKSACIGLGLSAVLPLLASGAGLQQWEVFETSFETKTVYANPFTDIEVNGVFQLGDRQWVVPAFWAGGDKWTLRFAPPERGQYRFHLECSDRGNIELNGKEQTFRVGPYRGANPLLKHGFLKASADGHHFAHADETPFFWLGDTWWKGLAKRLSWEGFQELTADRKAKGFSVVQIVCGSYPDEGSFEPRWENEGGKPYETRDFSRMNPAYFDYADRRLQHLVNAGIVPAIVGSWGRSDCDSMRMVGVKGLQRHWRHLVARYGAFPVVWILAGEIEERTKWGEGSWAEVARYLRKVDPYHHPLTCHTGSGRRGLPGDESLIDYDMLGGNHDGTNAVIPPTLAILTTACAKSPPMPVVCGETAYEGHMQQNFQLLQRHIFWMYMLNGAAGHTYGAAGVWQASVDGDPGISPVYDFTTWREGMNYPGSAQLGLGKKLLEQYPWTHFEPHPEWCDPDCYSAGIPGELRFIYQPRRGVYNWNGTVVKHLERGTPYHAFYFNPSNGKRYDLGTLINTGPPPKPFEGHTKPLFFSDTFENGDASSWKDYGTPTQRQGGHLAGKRNMVTIVETIEGADLMASVDAASQAEAGIILRFHDFDNYVVALYSPSLKSIFIHDRRNGQWGEALGQVGVPEIGPNIRLTAAVCGEEAALILTDGKKTYYTPRIKVASRQSGKVGLWFFQIGDRQEFSNFQVSKAQFAPLNVRRGEQTTGVPQFDDYKAPPLPSPQDWVLVLEREKAWKPHRVAMLDGQPVEDLAINGRSCEVFQHGVKPEWGYESPQVNAFFRWRCLSDTRERIEMSLFLVTAARLKTTFDVPSESTADVSLRRIQNRKVQPGETFRWRFRAARGQGKADSDGIITVPGLKITSVPATLIVSS